MGPVWPDGAGRSARVFKTIEQGLQFSIRLGSCAKHGHHFGSEFHIHGFAFGLSLARADPKNVPLAGTLLNGGEQAHTVLLTGSYSSIRRIIRTLRGWIASPSPEAPPVILNKHCPYCQFKGYDSIRCRQQKCWVHLIRDLNDDLWANPFNPEFEAFVSDVRDLIMAIFEAIDEYGLKKRNLSKFKNAVERFHKKTICDRVYESEVTCTYQKRFERYKQSLFVFLSEDNIAWNNNMAERAH